jgi:hypothetical protein
METQTKTCPRCGETKPVTEYRNQKNKPDGLNRVCKLCCKHYEQTAYNRNPKRYIDRGYKRFKNEQVFVNEYKQNKSCIRCGENRYWVIDFHHIDPSTKSYDISNMSGKFSKENILKEITKCVTLCRNCHYEFHHLERKENIKLDEYLNPVNHGN